MPATHIPVNRGKPKGNSLVSAIEQISTAAAALKLYRGRMLVMVDAAWLGLAPDQRAAAIAAAADAAFQGVADEFGFATAAGAKTALLLLEGAAPPHLLDEPQGAAADVPHVVGGE